MDYNVGRIILVGLSLLIFLGVTERVLDRMHLSNKGALMVLVALVAGSFINIPLYGSEALTVRLNLGGALVPIALAIYVLAKAGTNKERIRAMIGALVTATVIFLMGRYLTVGEYALPIDVIYIYPIIAAIFATIFGRSRKGAFISAVFGIALYDVFHGVYLIATGTPGIVHFGGAGIFDTIILSGVLAVVLTEVVGETRERMQGGPSSENRDPSVLKNLKVTGKTSAINLEEWKKDGKKK